MRNYMRNYNTSIDPATEATSCLEKLRGNHRVRVPGCLAHSQATPGIYECLL